MYGMHWKYTHGRVDASNVDIGSSVTFVGFNSENVIRSYTESSADLRMDKSLIIGLRVFGDSKIPIANYLESLYDYPALEQLQWMFFDGDTGHLRDSCHAQCPCCYFELLIDEYNVEV